MEILKEQVIPPWDEGGSGVDTSPRHSCESCKGTGKVASQRTGLHHGVKQTVEFMVDCPAKLTEQFHLGLPEADAGNKSRLR